MDIYDLFVIIPIGIAFITLFTQRTESVNQKINELRKEIQESCKQNYEIINKHESRLAQLEAYMNVILKSSTEIVKQPIHFVMDELIDKLMKGEATRDELLKLENILKQRYEMAVKAREPSAVFITLLLLKVQIELAKYDDKAALLTHA